MPPALASAPSSSRRRAASPLMPSTLQKPERCRLTWSHFVRGDVHALRSPRSSRGGEQAGGRFAVVVQSDALPLSTLLIAPTSTSSRPASFRPEVMIDGQRTRVLVEQTTAVDPTRLGDVAGHLSADELHAVDQALHLVLGL
jgi:mRNA interferase MazF